MKSVILTGATGMIGGLILEYCLNSDEISRVVTLTRKPLSWQHKKLHQEVINDFTDLTKVAEVFQNQDIAYYCLGVYTGQVNREEFRKITVDYANAFSVMLHDNSPEATFCFLSGQGADQSGKSKVMFARDKGIAENVLLKQGFRRTYLFRPAYIYPVTSRKEPNFMYSLMRKLYPLVKLVYPKGVITSEQLAMSMFLAGLKGASKSILENEDIKTLLKT